MRRSDSVLDTIVALATPAGRSALALVRLSGGSARQILGKLAPKGTEMEPRCPRLLRLCDETGEVVDAAIVTVFAGPASPTGEDVVEFSMHGSPVAVERLLRAATVAGARPARPGEFTERAFRAGKIDLVEAEAVRELIEARTPAAARASARRLAGKLSRRLDRIREDLLAAAAGLAATIDFAEDVGEGIAPEVPRRLHRAWASLDRLAANADRGRLLAHGCRVAILGRPNAGKSTLFNAVVGAARAIVTEVPGTTRDAIESLVDIGGIPATLVDTAGLRDTDDLVEKIGVARARAEAERADVIVYVFDASEGFREEDAQALARLDGRPRVLVANKADRLPAQALTEPAEAKGLCSLAPGAGQAVRDLIADSISGGIRTDETSEMLGSLRQRDLVLRARAAVTGALEALGAGHSPEYAVTHCHAALDAIADLVGETTSEDVLDRLFATFCIGK